jgi:kynurenine formamidase
MAATQYRAQVDVTVTFTNGGNLRAEGFRVDVPGPQVTAEEAGRLVLVSLGLLMSGTVEVTALSVLEEQHKGTRGGPSDGTPGEGAGAVQLVELSHVVKDGTITYPGLPAPTIRPFMTREASRATYAPGTEFALDVITMIGNTGTYLDSPFHRYADGVDLAGLPLASCVELPGVVVRTAGSGVRAVDDGALAALDVTARAVLLHTGGDHAWGRPEYSRSAPYLTEAGARWLVEHGARLVGIDSVNIDDTESGGSRPAHSVLLAAGIPVVEHLTGLEQLPPTGFRFSAAPARIAGFGTVTVRAYAAIPDREAGQGRSEG